MRRTRGPDARRDACRLRPIAQAARSRRPGHDRPVAGDKQSPKPRANGNGVSIARRSLAPVSCFTLARVRGLCSNRPCGQETNGSLIEPARLSRLQSGDRKRARTKPSRLSQSLEPAMARLYGGVAPIRPGRRKSSLPAGELSSWQLSRRCGRVIASPWNIASTVVQYERRSASSSHASLMPRPGNSERFCRDNRAGS